MVSDEGYLLVQLAPSMEKIHTGLQRDPAIILSLSISFRAIRLLAQKGTQVLQVGKPVPLVRVNVLQHHPAGLSLAGAPHPEQKGLIVGF